MIKYEHWQQVPASEWCWPSFSPREMACSGTQAILISPDFMDRLQALRDLVGPLSVTSGYRSPDFNRSIGGAEGVHPSGHAADIAINRKQAFIAVGLAAELGFTGIGIKQRGAGRFIHLDDLEATAKRPRPTIWSY